ncbi:hypothetical protein BDR04DRAFT_1093471, partial [Suillus decipiens]
MCTAALDIAKQWRWDGDRAVKLVENLKQYYQCKVRTFETLEKLRSNYSYHVHQRALAAGQPVRRKHAHMHTQNNDGIDTDLAMDLDTNFAWTPPLVSQNDVQQSLLTMK